MGEKYLTILSWSNVTKLISASWLVLADWAPRPLPPPRPASPYSAASFSSCFLFRPSAPAGAARRSLTLLHFWRFKFEVENECLYSYYLLIKERPKYDCDMNYIVDDVPLCPRLQSPSLLKLRPWCWTKVNDLKFWYMISYLHAFIKLSRDIPLWSCVDWIYWS